MNPSILIKNGTLVTMDSRNSIVDGGLFISDGRIAAIGETPTAADIVIDASDSAVLPGFIQTHLHLCQTLFRGAADDLALIDWLKKRVWPMEAAHTETSVRASARLAIAELIKGGTTCALTMETVRHTDEVFHVVAETGFRATIGKCMMDKGDEVPFQLHEETGESIRESVDIIERWHGKEDGRVRACFAPRFAVSCTPDLLGQVGRLALQHRVMIHTHASENSKECELVRQESGMRNITYLNSLGLSGRHVVLAHCVHVDDEEIEILRNTKTNVAHCPSSNLKLGSGTAPIRKMLDQSISVSLGADGAACNNRLDMFTEMRTAALLQKGLHGPEIMPAGMVLRMATIGGAHALGLENEIGSLEIGKRADVVIVDLTSPHLVPRSDLISSVVYSAQPSDVQTVVIDGRLVLREGKLLTLNEDEVTRDANVEGSRLRERAEKAGL